MQITFRKLTPETHSVTVRRVDGTTETVELNTRSFGRHDLAHLAVEVELGLRHGVWGSVAAGGSLTGDGLDGPDMDLAESLAGPVQTLMRIGAPVTDYRAVLARALPDDGDLDDLAVRLHERVRRLAGHWEGTPHHVDMVVEWPE